MSKRKRNQQHPLSSQSSSQRTLAQKQAGQNELAKEVISIIEARYSGPLPPPSALEHYNNIIPNGAERIMVMAEEQSKHRRQLEAKALNTDSRNSLLGVIFAFILGITTIITGGIIIFNGHSYSGTFLGSAGLFGLICAFIYGTKERRKERESKAKKS